jgi:hypothetical protein
VNQTPDTAAAPAVRTYPPGHLAAQGFRFLRCNGVFAWAHPLELKSSAPDFLDCTDMDDAEFERVVRATPGAA